MFRKVLIWPGKLPIGLTVVAFTRMLVKRSEKLVPGGLIGIPAHTNDESLTLTPRKVLVPRTARAGVTSII